MKKIKLLAIVGIVFFASSTINAQVSLGVNIGLPSIVISGHYERGYEPQRRTVEYQEDRVIYEESRDYDEDRWENERRYEEGRCDGGKHHDDRYYDKKYKGGSHKGRGNY